MLNKNIIYNEDYLVVVPYNYRGSLEGIDFSFETITILENEAKSINCLIDTINSNNFKQLIFVNYIPEYNSVMLNLNQKYNIKFIFTYSIASLSEDEICKEFYSICDLYNKNIISDIGVLDIGLYECLKKQKYNTHYLLIDIDLPKETDASYDETIIGILGDENDPKQNYYNQLSALKFEPFTGKISKLTKRAKKFVKKFDIDYKVAKSNADLLKNNLENLYINFTLTDILVFLKSMDNGVPCILGNTDILDGYVYLRNRLVMNSDDDIDEISNRIISVRDSRNKILNDYKLFRKDYSLKSKKSIYEFLDIKENKMIEKENELLLTVVIPVYNTSKYLAESLQSVIDAKIDNMEILVINDGSTDNSEEIIEKYCHKYPELIRYIKQKNHGLGNVRNVGLKEAKGKYIASVDSDDTIDINFFSDALIYLNDDIDVVVCDWLSINDENRFNTPAIDYIFKDGNKYEGLLYTTIMPSTCNKIIKKSIFNELSIKYIEDKYEDFSTNPFILFASKKIAYIEKPYYKYFIRANSIMRTKPGYSMIDVIKQVNERMEKYRDYISINYNKLLYYMFSWRIEEYIINQIYDIDEEEVSDYAKYINKNIKDILIELFNNKYYLDMLKNIKDNNFVDFINKRNDSIKNGEFEKFINDSRTRKKYYKISPNIIYYGE